MSKGSRRHEPREIGDRLRFYKRDKESMNVFLILSIFFFVFFFIYTYFREINADARIDVCWRHDILRGYLFEVRIPERMKS